MNCVLNSCADTFFISITFPGRGGQPLRSGYVPAVVITLFFNPIYGLQGFGFVFAEAYGLAIEWAIVPAACFCLPVVVIPLADVASIGLAFAHNAFQGFADFTFAFFISASPVLVGVCPL